MTSTEKLPEQKCRELWARLGYLASEVDLRHAPNTSAASSASSNSSSSQTLRETLAASLEAMQSREARLLNDLARRQFYPTQQRGVEGVANDDVAAQVEEAAGLVVLWTVTKKPRRCRRL